MADTCIAATISSSPSIPPRGACGRRPAVHAGAPRAPHRCGAWAEAAAAPIRHGRPREPGRALRGRAAVHYHSRSPSLRTDLQERPAPMPKTVILGAARTPIGKMGGGLSSLDATELGGLAISAALERSGVEPEQVDHVVVGQVLQAGQGQIPSRQAQIKAGIPKEVSSETVNKVCASGLRASVILDQAIRAGDVQVGVGAGMESMSKAPYLLPQARFGYRMGDAKMLDAMVHDGLTCLLYTSDAAD